MNAQLLIVATGLVLSGGLFLMAYKIALAIHPPGDPAGAGGPSSGWPYRRYSPERLFGYFIYLVRTPAWARDDAGIRSRIHAIRLLSLMSLVVVAASMVYYCTGAGPGV